MTQTKALVKIEVNSHSKFIFRSYKCLQGPCYYQAGSLDLADVTDCEVWSRWQHAVTGMEEQLYLLGIDTKMISIVSCLLALCRGKHWTHKITIHSFLWGIWWGLSPAWWPPCSYVRTGGYLTGCWVQR